MDIELLVASMLRGHGFVVTSSVLTVHRRQVLEIDFHPPNLLLYAEWDLQRGFAFNHNIYVNPRDRHKGVGARLWAAYEEVCREVELTILINNNRNPPFWKRQGYRRLNPFWQMLLAKRLGIAFKEHSVYKKQ